ERFRRRPDPARFLDTRDPAVSCRPRQNESVRRLPASCTTAAAPIHSAFDTISSSVSPWVFPQGGHTPMRPPFSMKLSRSSLTGGKLSGARSAARPRRASSTPSRDSQRITSPPAARAVLAITSGAATRSPSPSKLVSVKRNVLLPLVALVIGLLLVSV